MYKIWKNFALWFKGALFGLITSLVLSIGLFINNPTFNIIASPGLLTCKCLTECGNYCAPCNVIGLMFNLIYGFVIGVIIGYLIEKMKGESKPKLKNRKKKK